MGHKNNLTKKTVSANTLYWLKSTVIHYNLCPFANKVYCNSRLVVNVTEASTEKQLLEECLLTIQQLLKTPRSEIETILLVHPQAMNDFSEYNDFLGMVDVLLEKMDLLGIVQVASFHPDYCFANSKPDDAANFTNRSPYPMLHILREESVSEVVDEWEERGLNVADIPNKNIETLNKIGSEILADQLSACFK